MSSPRRSLTVLWVVLSVPVLALLAFVAPAAYGCWAHPLARLERQLDEGTTWAEADSLFAAYAARHGAGEDFQLTRQDPMSGTNPLAPEGARRLLFVYEWFFMDDLQLSAWFDADGAFVGSSYVCD